MSKLKLFYAVMEVGDGTTRTRFFSSKENWTAFCDENEKYDNILEARTVTLNVGENSSFEIIGSQ